MLGTSEGKANELEGQRNTLVIKRKHTKSRLKWNKMEKCLLEWEKTDSRLEWMG